MNTRAWIGAFMVALGLHVGLAIALLAVDARATVPASLHDDGGIDIGLGSVEVAAANAPTNEPTPAAAPPPPVQPRAADAATVAPAISAVTTSEPPAPDAVVVASAPEPATPAPTSAPSATTVTATASTTTVASAGHTGGDSGATTGVAGTAQRGGEANYFGKLKAWLNQHKRYPVAAKKEKQQGTVTVTFTIDRSGRLLASRVEKSSGNTVLDNAALELLRKASPLPRMPETMPQAQLVVTLPVEYSLITR